MSNGFYALPTINLAAQLQPPSEVRVSSWQTYQRGIDTRSGSLTVRDEDGNTLYAGLLPSGELGFQIVDENGDTVFDPFATDVSGIALKVGTGDSTPTLNAILAGTGAGTSAWTTTLAGLTLTIPVIANFSNANHDHTNATGGGQVHIVNATTNTLTVARGGTGATTASDARTALGAGDVVGPGTSADNKLVAFDGTTGKLIKDSGISATTLSAQITDLYASATFDADTSLAGNGYFLDEDDMASDSATKVPSQQSVKAYVDDQTVVIGSDVQAYDAILDDLSGITFSQGDILYHNGSNLVRLAAGTDGHFLKTQGAGANPVWAAGAGGGISLSDVYPVGSIYIETTGTNPNTTFGFGTWVAFGSGKVLVGLDSGDTDFDAAEETGGAKTHTHSLSDSAVAQIIISSTGDIRQRSVSAPASWDPDSHMDPGTRSDGGSAATNGVPLRGNTDSGSNMPPYIVVHMWKRTA